MFIVKERSLGAVLGALATIAGIGVSLNVLLPRETQVPAQITAPSEHAAATLGAQGLPS